jgi:hypothetical protein
VVRLARHRRKSRGGSAQRQKDCSRRGFSAKGSARVGLDHVRCIFVWSVRYGYLGSGLSNCDGGHPQCRQTFFRDQGVHVLPNSDLAMWGIHLLQPVFITPLSSKLPVVDGKVGRSRMLVRSFSVFCRRRSMWVLSTLHCRRRSKNARASNWLRKRPSPGLRHCQSPANSRFLSVSTHSASL